MDLKARAKKIKTDIPAVFLALKDNETSWNVTKCYLKICGKMVSRRNGIIQFQLY